ncbi:MAG: hypothetical protein ACLVEV_05420 [Lachnospiraceae bacterium]
MHQNNRWKTVIQYTAGIVIVALCITAAMFLPEQYAQWSDEQTIGKVTLSKRDTIEFLNIEKLDIEKRLEMLQNADDFYFLANDGPMMYLSSDAEFIEMSKRLIGGWCEAGLLPESCERLLSEAMGDVEQYSYQVELYPVWWYGIFGDYEEQGMLPMLTVRVSDEYGMCNLIFAMDPEVEVLYWAVFSGDMAVQQIIKELGYGSSDEVERYLQEHGELQEPQVEPREIDFAAAFGAKSAQVHEEPDLFEITAKLTFDTFEAEAMRCLTWANGGTPGIAAMYGTDKGARYITELFAMQGAVAECISTEEFLEMTKNEGMQEKEEAYSYNE